MKQTRKLVAFVLAAALILSLSLTCAFAAPIEKDGIQAKLSANAQNEQSVTVKLSNNSDERIQNIVVETVLPEGFKTSQAVKKLAALDPEKSAAFDFDLLAEAVAAPAEPQTQAAAPETEAAVNSEAKNEAPETGDSSIALYAVLAGAALVGVIGIVAFKTKNGKKIVSLALAVVIASGAFLGAVLPADAAGKDGEINLTETVKIGDKDVKVTAKITFEKADKAQLTLKASEKDLPQSEDKAEVTFFAEGNRNYKSVTLYSADKKELAKMLDDGKNGDVKANDGIYTYVADITAKEVKDLDFYAVGATAFKKEITSNTVKISVFKPIEEKELKKMENVDKEITDLVDNDEFKALPEDVKKAQAEDLINKQTENGAIKKNSVSYDDENQMFTFEYTSGIIGGIMLKEFNDFVSPAEKPANVVNKLAPTLNPLDNLKPLPVKNGKFGNAIIYYAFDFYYFSPRAPYYKKILNDWNSRGLNTTLDRRVTVRDLKSIDLYDVIIFSTHGTYMTLDGQSFPVICLREYASFIKDYIYSQDLRERNILKINGSYFIRPQFFEKHYNDLELLNKLVFSESCCFMGENKMHDTSFANVFLNKGVKTVVGFHNSVYAVYSVDFMKTYFDSMMDGLNAAEAFEKSKTLYGEDDYVWAMGKFGKANINYFATPNLVGESSAKMPISAA